MGECSPGHLVLYLLYTLILFTQSYQIWQITDQGKEKFDRLRTQSQSLCQCVRVALWLLKLSALACFCHALNEVVFAVT